MSRTPNRENIAAFCSENLSTLADNLTSLTIADPTRLKIPFGSKGKLSGRQQVAWPVVAPLYEDHHDGGRKTPITKPSPSQHPSSTEVVLEVCSERQERSDNHQTGVPGWFIPVGYIVFGLTLALCNLLTLSWSRLVCSSLSPLPMACLTAQALSYDSRLAILVFAFSWLIPLECVAWNQYAVIPYCIVLAGTLIVAAPRRGLFTWLSFFGVFLSLCLSLPVHTFDPKWGVTLSLFFMCLLCTVTSLSNYTRVTYRLKYLQ